MTYVLLFAVAAATYLYVLGFTTRSVQITAFSVWQENERHISLDGDAFLRFGCMLCAVALIATMVAQVYL